MEGGAATGTDCLEERIFLYSGEAVRPRVSVGAL